jgi:hypothetical protein
MAQNTSSKPRKCSDSSAKTYNQEPFETFKEKVTLLAADIKAAKIYNVRHRYGGAFNRIVLATVQWNARRTPDDQLGRPIEQEVIFRIPRVLPDHTPSGNIQSQVAIHRLVRHRGILAPEPLAFDATAQNAIGSPYAVFTYVQGKNLAVAYKQMSLQEKIEIVDEYIQLLAQIGTNKFTQAGILAVRKADEHVERWFLAAEGKSALHSSEVDIRRIRYAYLPAKDGGNGEDTSALSFLQTTFDDWHIELAGLTIQGYDVTQKRERVVSLQDICHEMRQHERYSSAWRPGDYILHHWDLEPRNVIVQREAGGTPRKWRIAAVLDWDDALSVPRAFTCRPPIWLWDDEYQSRPVDFDVDTLPSDYYSQISTDAKAVKNHFEKSYIEHVLGLDSQKGVQEYSDMAYGTGRWLRRMWWFVESEFDDAEDAELLDRLEREWKDQL